MSTVLKIIEEFSDMQGISVHPAFRNNVTGLEAEKMLRGKTTPYLYLIREGEKEKGSLRNYYITFVASDFSVRHQPFTIEERREGWYYENAQPGGPYTDATIDDVVHLMIHCSKDSCVPFLN